MNKETKNSALVLFCATQTARLVVDQSRPAANRRLDMRRIASANGATNVATMTTAALRQQASRMHSWTGSASIADADKALRSLAESGYRASFVLAPEDMAGMDDNLKEINELWEKASVQLKLATARLSYRHDIFSVSFLPNTPTETEAEEPAAAPAAPESPVTARKRAKAGLPIDLPEKVRQALPTGAKEHKELIPDRIEGFYFPEDTTRALALGLSLRQPTWLHGPSGCGKTALVEQIAARLGLPVWTISCHDRMEPADMLGQTELVEGKSGPVTRFVHGPIPQAMRHPGIILLDELDSVPTSIAFSLLTLLDRGRIQLAENKGELVQAHPDCWVVATGNTAGAGDETGMYAGVQSMSTALLDRFTMSIRASYPPAQEIVDACAVAHPTISDSLKSKLTLFVAHYHEAFTIGSVGTPLSFRGVQAIMDLVCMMDSEPSDSSLLAAIAMVLLGKMDETQKTITQGVLDRI